VAPECGAHTVPYIEAKKSLDEVDPAQHRLLSKLPAGIRLP